MRSSHSKTAMNPGNLTKLPLPQDCNFFGAHDVVSLISLKLSFLFGGIFIYVYITTKKEYKRFYIGFILLTMTRRNLKYISQLMTSSKPCDFPIRKQ